MASAGNGGILGPRNQPVETTEKLNTFTGDGTFTAQTDQTIADFFVISG